MTAIITQHPALFLAGFALQFAVLTWAALNLSVRLGVDRGGESHE